MAETPSTMIPLGTKAPDFILQDVRTKQSVSLQNLKSDKATVIMFICNHCPYVKHILHELIETAKSYQAKGVHFIAISANDADTYPDDSPAAMQALAEKLNFPFPYLYDESQNTARAYHAACTPDFFLFDGSLQCVYRGRFDNATPGNQQAVTGADLCRALDHLLENKAIGPDQKPSLGCNIKWKKTK